MDASPLRPPPTTIPDRARPLLPPVLLGPATFLWLWVLPLGVLLALNVQAYGLVEGNMDAAQRGRALVLGVACVINILTGLALAVAGRRREQAGTGTERSVWWALPAIVVQGGYLWMATAWVDDVLPASVFSWLYPPQRYLYNQFAFAMPALFWGVMRLACAGLTRGRRREWAGALAMAVGAPLALYVASRVLRHVRWMGDLDEYLLATLAICLGLLMFVGIIRLLVSWLRKMEGWGTLGESVAILVFAVGLPVGGLLLNREIAFPSDFQAWEVYALTGLNAAVLLAASWQHARRPLLSLGLLCATLPFSLYFFVVFLPFLPLAILAVVFFGAGFLMLSPTVLFVLHLCLLNKARLGPRRRRWTVGMLCFLLLPGLFVARGLADRAALNAALDHVFSPTITARPITYASSRINLRRALASHRDYKNGVYYPLLSDFYAWLVFDNLVLPDDKLARLEGAFFGKAAAAEDEHRVHTRGIDVFGGGVSVRDRNRMPRATRPPRTVTIQRMDVGSAPAEGEATVVTVALTLVNGGDAPAEFVQALPLPAGVFVSGFRLHIEGVAVPGRITEKKTALWVYSMIRDSERRDPGLLFYNAPDELELRVFPVAARTPSVVEIDFLVPGGAVEIAGFGNDPAEVLRRIGRGLRPLLAETGRGTVATGVERSVLPVAEREAYLHVIVDRSADNGFDGDLGAALATLRERFPEARSTRVTLANYESVELPAEAVSGAAEWAVLPLRGGFVPDLALAQAIRRHRDADLDTGGAEQGPPPRPVFVVLGRVAPAAAEDLGLEVANAWADVPPVLEVHAMGANGVVKNLIRPTGDGRTPVLRRGTSVRPLVAGRATRFAAGSGDGRLEYWSPAEFAWRAVEEVTTADAGSPWTRAAGLMARQQDHDRAPGDAGVDLKTLVKESRESGVMVASTSYIVVENAAQWRMLELAEKQKLDQSAELDFKEAPAPSWVWLAGGFALWAGWRRRRARPC